MRQGSWGAWPKDRIPNCGGWTHPTPHRIQTLTCKSQKSQEPLCLCTPFLHSHPQALLACLVCAYGSCLLYTVPPLGSLPAHPRLRGCCTVLWAPVAPCPPISLLLLLNHSRVQFVFLPVSSLRSHSSLLFWFLASRLAQSQSR